MLTYILVAIIIVLILFIVSKKIKKDKFSLKYTIDVRSDVDGEVYRVHSMHDDTLMAANTMARINANITKLLRHLREKYVRNPNMTAKYPRRTQSSKRILTLYNPDNLTENSPRDPEGDTSYTINKGEVLAMCIRKKSDDSNPLHDLNSLMFVALHELSHIAIADVAHPPIFWEAFKFILGEAYNIGILDPVEYYYHPVKYCGIVIDYNPAYDIDVKNYI